MVQPPDDNWKADTPSVGALIIAWNRRDDVIDCIESLVNSGYPRLAIYVVDNASTDGTSELVASRYPQVIIMRSETNLGFAGGNNLGMQRIIDDGMDAVFLLNDDAVVEGNAIGILTANGYSDKSVGILSPKILLHSDPEVIWSSGGNVDPRSGITEQRQYGQKDDLADNRVTEIDYAVGCAMLVKSEVIKQVGMLDERYFTYYEETDWCRRIRNAGYKILYIPESRVRHKVPLIVKNRNNAAYYYTRNRLLYLNSAGAPDIRIIWIAISDLLKTAASYSIKGRLNEGKLVLKGVIDYYTKRFGRMGDRT